MASHRERIMEKTRNFQTVYAGLTDLCQYSSTDLARGIMTNEHKQSMLAKVRSSKHSKTISIFLYSMYHQGAGKISLFHMRGIAFKHFNTCCTFNLLFIFSNISEIIKCKVAKLVHFPATLTISFGEFCIIGSCELC